jgi:hypothetical protein
MKGGGEVLGFIRVCRSCPLEDKFASSSNKELTAYGGLAYVIVGLLIVEQQQQQRVAVRIYRTCIPHPSTNNKTWVRFHGSILLA